MQRPCHRQLLVVAMALSFLCAAENLWAYTVNCDPNSDSILSVLGETRPPTNPFTRYHTGVDLDGCNDTEPVNVIVGGRVEYVPECGIGDDACRRVVAADGSAFDYLHITNARVVGSTISVGEQIGIISGGHLHLAQIQRVGTFAINPQFPGQLTFDRTADPLPTYMNITVGGVTDSVIPVQAFNQDLFPNQVPVPFTKASNGIYYLRDNVDVLVTVNAQPFVGGNDRKGVFMVGVLVLQTGSLNRLFDGRANIPFQTIVDQLPNSSGLKTIYYSAQTESRTYWATNLKINNVSSMQARDSQWNSSTAPEGAIKLCGVVKNFPGANELWNCKDAVIDRTAPTVTLTDTADVPFSFATSSTTIKVVGTETVSASGIYTITLSSSGGSQTSTNTSVTTSYTATFSGLTDGSYTATVTDLAGNQASAGFSVDSSGASGGGRTPGGNPFPSNPPDSCLVVTATSTYAGVKKITVSGPSYGPFTTTFSCDPPVPSAKVGPYCSLTPGTYAITREDCAGTQKIENPEISTAAYRVVLAGPLGRSATFYPTIDEFLAGTTIMTFKSTTGASSGTKDAWCVRMAVTSPPYGSGASPDGCELYDTGAGYAIRRVFTGTGLGPGAFHVYNASDTPPGFGVTIQLESFPVGGGSPLSGQISYDASEYATTLSESIDGTIAASAVGQPQPVGSPDGVANSSPTYSTITVSGCTPASNVLQQLTAQLLASVMPSWNPYCWAGSEAVFVSSIPMSFAFQGPAGVTIDTTTLGIYGYDKTTSLWTRDMAVNQVVSLSTSGYIVASGSFTRTGTYGVYFVGIDTSSPVTNFSIQGSSFVFDQTLFVSTDAYVVLTATDPLVNGFASTVATVTYRLDPTSGTAYSVYSSSIPLPLGTHVFEYRSLDYAGNIETVKTATFTVTAGTAFRNSSTQQVGGTLLNGFLGSGAKLEIESQAQNDLTLLISSVNRQGMLAVDNIGEVGIGATPQANLDIGPAPIALQLRSGNSTSSVTSAQIAFAYDGDGSYRHFLRTEHSTSTDGNKMDFLVWNPGAGSTTTLASLNVLSLQGIAGASGGSFHVNPAGEPDAEVEVSNGATTGGGTIQYGELLAPSSRRFKTDIKDLSEADEARALADVAALKHVRFRYLADDPAQPPHTGLIYEEVPESLRGADGTLSTIERLANAEMALKAAMVKLEKLQKRYAELKKRGKP